MKYRNEKEDCIWYILGIEKIDSTGITQDPEEGIATRRIQSAEHRPSLDQSQETLFIVNTNKRRKCMLAF